MSSKSSKNGAYEILVAQKDAITKITGIITPESIKTPKMNLVEPSPYWNPPISLRENDTGTLHVSYQRRSTASSLQTQHGYTQHRSIQVHMQPQPLQQEWAWPIKPDHRATQRNTDGIHQVSRCTGSREGISSVWHRQWCFSTAKEAIHQLWQFNQPLNDTTPLWEDGNQDDHLPEVWIKDWGIWEAVGSNDKHHGLLHGPWQVSNLFCWPWHRNNHQGDDNGGRRKNVGEQDVHQGLNGCMGEQNCRAANLEESPGLLHGKMARAKTILASHCKTFPVQGCSPCSPRAGSSRVRRQDHHDDVCPPPRSTWGPAQGDVQQPINRQWTQC